MILLKLGLTNARRHLARSAIAILSMALAAGFLTYSMSLSRGYPSRMKHDYRAAIGGEIIVYAQQFDAVVPEGESTWSYQRYRESPLTDLATFHPQLFKRGFLSSVAESPAFASEELAAYLDIDEITAVYPRYQLPAQLLTSVGQRTLTARGRDARLDQQLSCSPNDLVVSGRWFQEQDEERAVAVLSRHQNFLKGETLPPIGSIIRLSIPRIRYRAGELQLDYLDPIIAELQVIGHIDVVTRYLETGQETENIPVYWQFDEIQLPLSTWQSLWRQAGGDAFVPQQLSLLSKDITYLEDQVAALRQRFPERTFISVPQQAESAQRQGLIERNVPPQYGLQKEQTQQAALQMDVRLPMIVLIFINAALVVSANLLIMVNERRTEVGILKAVGAKRIQVVIMVLAEALLISSIGAIFGFLFFRIPALFNQMIGGTSNSTLLFILLRDLLIVFGVTSGASLIFGMLPALQMARLSVQEVLQSE